LPEDEIAAAQVWNDAMSGTLKATPQTERRRKGDNASVVPIDSGKKSA
jgi:hypothetical protein